MISKINKQLHNTGYYLKIKECGSGCWLNETVNHSNHFFALVMIIFKIKKRSIENCIIYNDFLFTHISHKIVSNRIKLGIAGAQDVQPTSLIVSKTYFLDPLFEELDIHGDYETKTALSQPLLNK